MSDKPGVNTASYLIRTLDGRVLAYGRTGGGNIIPPPAKPVIAYPPGSIQPQPFEISQVEQDKNRYYISYLIERDGLLYDQVTAPQKWIITFVPVPNRVVFVIETEDGRAWAAPLTSEEGPVRVQPIVYEDPPKYPSSVLFELTPVSPL